MNWWESTGISSWWLATFGAAPGSFGTHSTAAMTLNATMRNMRKALTTQAQRPGTREVMIATAMLMPGSLQRMVCGRFVSSRISTKAVLQSAALSPSGAMPCW